MALSPFAINKFTHTVTSSWIIGATFVVAVSCWYLLKKRETQLAKASIKMGAGVGLIATLLAAMTGDNSAYHKKIATQKEAEELGVKLAQKIAEKMGKETGKFPGSGTCLAGCVQLGSGAHDDLYLQRPKP